MHTISGRTVQFTEDGLSIRAYLGGIRVGNICFSDKGNGTILLGDIEVEEKVEIRKSWFDRKLRRVHPEWGVIRPRRCRIGSELLGRFIAACDSLGIREIYGNVTPDADRDLPFLREWYRSFGFVITSPDGRDEWFPVAYKVVRTRARSARDISVAS